MSRVADALRLAKLDRPGPDAFSAHGHPWGRDLDGDINPDVTWTTEGEGVPAGQPDPEPPSPNAQRVAETIRKAEIVPATSPLDHLAPAVRQQISGVVDRVFLSTSGEVPRIVAFAGIDADAQSGWIAAAVADMLAQRSTASVAIVDVNLASPSLHECFGIRLTPGLVEALASETPLADWARQVRENLAVIPAGEPAGATELTAGSRARIARLATAFDHVILNLEPLAAWCGGGLPAVADGIVLVIAADATRRQAGRQVAERLQTSGAAVLGAVLTNRRYAIPEAIYKRL